MRNNRLTVMKFGGSSVGTPERFKRIPRIVQQVAQDSRVLVVVSALSNVTRQLDAAFQKASSGIMPGRTIGEIRDRHIEHAGAVLSKEYREEYASHRETLLADLEATLRHVRKQGGSPIYRDSVLSCGERLSVPLVVLALRDAGIDSDIGEATELVATDDEYGAANVYMDETSRRLGEWFARCNDHVVPAVGGFIGSTSEGRVTTLGFEGSDYTASIIARILHADTLIRWTDVDGVYTADPRLNSDARRIDEIQMRDALTRNAEGNMGMHRKALLPLADSFTRIYIRSIDQPDQPGTKIVPEGDGG